MSFNRTHFVPNPDPASIAVPGVDPTAPATVQLEQIEQLITLRMANIDNNLSRAHQIITSQILPSIQRFARVSQPTRDSARFWKSFFEAAAQVQVTSGADYSSTETGLDIAEDHSREETTSDSLISQNESFVSTAQSSVDRTPNDHSFAGVVASTPARGHGLHGDTTHDTTASDPSWSPSHGSLMGHFKIDESQSSFGEVAQPHRHKNTNPSSIQQRTSVLAQPSPFIDEISSSSDASSFHPPDIPDSTKSTSGNDSINSADDSFEVTGPRRTDKGKGKFPTDLRQNVLRQNARGTGTTKLAKYNPFLEKPSDSSKWNGIVDLSSSPSLSIVASSPNFSSLLSTSSSQAGIDAFQAVPSRSTSLESNVSKSIQFPAAPRDVVATPSKAAAELMVTDLLAGFDLEDTPGAAAPTPPSLARYKTYRTESQPKSTGLPVGPWRPVRPQVNQVEEFSNVQQSFLANPLINNDDDFQQNIDEDDSFSDEDDADDYEDMHEQSGPADIVDNVGDDSFDSDLSFDGGGRVEAPGRNPSHPQEEDTLFGPRGNPPASSRGFQLETQDSMHTYMGGRLEDAAPLQGSPTPFAGDFVALGRRRK